MNKKHFVARIVRVVGYCAVCSAALLIGDIAWWLWDVTREPSVLLPTGGMANLDQRIRNVISTHPYALQCRAVEAFNAPALKRIATGSTIVKISYSIRRPRLINWLHPSNIGFWHQVLIVPADQSSEVSIIRMLDVSDFEKALLAYRMTVRSEEDAAVVYQAWYESAYCYQYQTIGRRANALDDDHVVCENEQSIWRIGRSNTPPCLWACTVETNDEGVVQKFRTCAK